MNVDFTVNKETKTVSIQRDFSAGLSLVWDACTTPELLDLWWAPKPFTSRTKVMDFKVGGRRFYAMVSPEGKESWAVQTYTSITPKTDFTFVNAFADADENPELPGSDWALAFNEHDGTTRISISIYNESLERLERMIAFGFREGAMAQLNALDELLTKVLPATETRQ